MIVRLEGLTDATRKIVISAHRPSLYRMSGLQILRWVPYWSKRIGLIKSDPGCAVGADRPHGGGVYIDFGRPHCLFFVPQRKLLESSGLNLAWSGIEDRCVRQQYGCRFWKGCQKNLYPEEWSFGEDDSRQTDYFGPRSSLTVSLCLPLARRRANTLRPLAVSMRERKPCLLTRFLLLGWNVRFIAGKCLQLNVMYEKETGSICRKTTKIR